MLTRRHASPTGSATTGRAEAGSAHQSTQARADQAGRLYAPGDVVRLDLLRHLAEAKVNTAVAGPKVAVLDVPDGDVRVLWGPFGERGAGLVTVAVAAALSHLGVARG